MSEVTKTSVDDATPVLVANAALGALAFPVQQDSQSVSERSHVAPNRA